MPEPASKWGEGQEIRRSVHATACLARDNAVNATACLARDNTRRSEEYVNIHYATARALFGMLAIAWMLRCIEQ